MIKFFLYTVILFSTLICSQQTSTNGRQTAEGQCRTAAYAVHEQSKTQDEKNLALVAFASCRQLREKKPPICCFSDLPWVNN
jgi:hypothetical protein